MPDRIASLVERVAAHWVPPPIVNIEQYRALSCNRCGACCEDVRLPHTPAELERLATDPVVEPEQRAFAAGLVPIAPSAGGWQYRCRHFDRDAQGLGACAVYETRPAVCRDFPLGGVVRRWSQCVWFVEVRDETGRILAPPELQRLSTGQAAT